MPWKFLVARCPSTIGTGAALQRTVSGGPAPISFHAERFRLFKNSGSPWCFILLTPVLSPFRWKSLYQVGVSITPYMHAGQHAAKELTHTDSALYICLSPVIPAIWTESLGIGYHIKGGLSRVEGMFRQVTRGVYLTVLTSPHGKSAVRACTSPPTVGVLIAESSSTHPGSPAVHLTPTSLSMKSYRSCPESHLWRQIPQNQIV